MDRCRRSVCAALQTLTTTNPTLAAQLPGLGGLINNLQAGGHIQPPPVPAPSLFPADTVNKTVAAAAGVASAPKSAPLPAMKMASQPKVKAAGQPKVKAAGQPIAKAKEANSSLSRTPAAERCLPGDGHQAKRPCPASASLPVPAGSSQKAKQTKSPALAPSRKRKATAGHGRHVDLESEAMDVRGDAELKARLEDCEQALLRLTKEVADHRRQFALVPNWTHRAEPKMTLEESTRQTGNLGSHLDKRGKH